MLDKLNLVKSLEDKMNLVDAAQVVLKGVREQNITCPQNQISWLLPNHASDHSAMIIVD